MTERSPTPSAPPARLRRLPSWLLHHCAAHANRIVGHHLNQPGERMRYAILAALHEVGATSQADLCRRLGIDPGDAVTTLNNMESDGLVQRTPDPADRRRNIVCITNAGVTRLHELDALVDQAQDDLLAPLTQAERDTLAHLLRRLIGVPPP